MLFNTPRTPSQGPQPPSLFPQTDYTTSNHQTIDHKKTDKIRNMSPETTSQYDTDAPIQMHPSLVPPVPSFPSSLVPCFYNGINMKCPYCGFAQDRVVDSRESKEADSIRRRRECEKCERRFTTYERIDEIPYMVVKKDGRRERFDRQKVLSGLLRACEKRPVSSSQLEKVVDATEQYLMDAQERERSTREIGELIMTHLKGLDTVAYIRFASVYRSYPDVQAMRQELDRIIEAEQAQNGQARAKKRATAGAEAGTSPAE